MGGDEDVGEFTGRTEAIKVEIRSRVGGHLAKVHFKEGADVKKGEVLFELDARPYQAEVGVAQAEMALSEARLKLAEAEHRRAAKLLEAKAISREESDKIAASFQVATAELQVARAKLERARVSLEFTRITSPIDGKAGKALVAVGNLIAADAPGNEVLVTVSATDPIYVRFQVDEKAQLRLRRLYEERKGEGKNLTIGVRIAHEDGNPRQATIDFIDTQVDPATGTLQVRAVLANPKGELLPGQAARVRVPLGSVGK
jgi:RND family efflux transporter MFP subunit